MNFCRFFIYTSTTCRSPSVAVVPQPCWILNATVRDNIIFGRPFEAERYHQVIEAASLEQDFKLFANDDQTEIGEKVSVFLRD
jgi:ABC-type multidrug transport system fused ATPase/permease subunit